LCKAFLNEVTYAEKFKFSGLTFFEKKIRKRVLILRDMSRVKE